ncbi:MAG: HEAT repeat domain-containing protein [Bryobacteraceae bacterium]
MTSITELIHELPSQYVVPALRASDGPDEAVARVFLGHLASKRPDSSEGWRARESLAYFARERKGRIPAALREFGTEALSSADLDTRALGISLSVMENSVSAPMLIDQAQSVLGEQRAETVIRHFRNNFSADETLAARAVIRLLGNARSENLKEACVRVLSRAHTRPVLPVLVEMLGSGNPQVRGVAVRGLADFANNVPPGKSQKAPGPWRYRTDETEARGAGDIERLAQPASIQFWRAWWERYGKELAE